MASKKSKKITKVAEPSDDDDLEDDDSHAAIKSKRKSKRHSSKSKKRKKDKYFAGYAVKVHIQTHIYNIETCKFNIS